jgi:cyclopropane fatty-acyl-phospholipid synthase-like methyltransferase
LSTDPLHAMWSAAAPSWGEYADYVDERGAVVGEAMLAAADIRPGAVVLELGCGPGGVGFSAADLVGADGQVVLSDVAPEMTAIAADRAEHRWPRCWRPFQTA